MGDEIKLNKVVNWCKRFKPNIICLQETHCTNARKGWYLSAYNSNWYHSIGDSNARGVSISISKDLNYTLVHSEIDENGRYIVLDIAIDNERYLIGNYYGANIDCPDHLQEYLNLLSPTEGQQIISAGDYNFVLNVNMDKRGGRPRTHEKSKNLLLNWNNAVDTIDIWRVKHPNTFDYTWRSWSAPFVYCRLDYYIISSSLCNKVQDCIIKTSFMSDHRCVLLTISDKKVQRGPGFWKFNNSLLSDREYTNKIITVINDTLLDNKGCTPPLMFDTIKCRIRGATVKYSSYKKKNNKIKFAEWSGTLSLLQQQLATEDNPVTMETLKDEIEEVSSKIDRFIDETTRGTMMRSRCQDYEEGERNSKYFYNLEKSNGAKKSIQKLIDDSGFTVTGTKNILHEEVKYYNKLYRTRENVYGIDERTLLFDIFTDDEHPTLTENNKKELVEDITEQEVFDILCSFSDNKSPGTDGLSKEFYKHFWTSLKDPLLDSYRHSLNTGLLSIDQRKGIITLIPKKDKDNSVLKNWRPLTILNIDYKILAKLLAARLKYLLPSIIHTDQTGFVPNRYIGCNINRLLNTIDYCNDNSVEAMLIAIDFEKAFDSMEWSFVYKAMKYFGFPDLYINWVKILYNSTESCIINDGHISDFFSPTRGVKQGCPMSPYLFIIGAEIMARYLRRKDTIRPINISDTNTILSQYADDTTVITFRSKEAVLDIFECLDKFAIMSGLKVNKGKTQVMLIGHNLNESRNIEQICSITDTVYILGINISCSKEEMIRVNYLPIIGKIKHTLNIWSQRNLSLFGKIEVLKTQAISRLVYVMSLLPSPPKDCLEEIDRMLLNFCWSNKPAKIRKTVLKTCKDMGGAGMVDLRIKDLSLKLNWLKRLVSFDGCWKDYISVCTKNLDMEYFLNCNVKHNDMPFKFNNNSIWNDVFNYWCKYNYWVPEGTNNYKRIENCNIWYNSNIKISKKIVMWKEWYNNNIKVIGDLFNYSKARFYSWNEFTFKYKIKCNFLQYASLISAIPKHWKQILINTYSDDNEDIEVEKDEMLIDILMSSNKPSGAIYRRYVNDANDQPWDRFDKWSKEINMDAFDTEIDWYKHIHIWYSCTRSVQIRSFIYKFNMRTIATRKYLHKVGITENPTCIKCKKEDETQLHLFWACESTKRLWYELNEWLSMKLCIDLSTTCEAVLMNILNIDVTYHELVSFIYTVCLRVIYINRDSLTDIKLCHVVNTLKKYEKMERLNAMGVKRIQNHFNKWLILYTQWYLEE